VRAPSEPINGGSTSTAGSTEVEEFAHNVARMMEEGGRALAAYLRPREEGTADDQYSEMTDIVKTLGQVGDYWLRDPQRALELQSSLGKAYLDLWGNAVKRLAGEQVTPVAAPDPRDKRFADPEWSSNQFFDFLKQAYLLTVEWAHRLVQDAKGLDPHTLHKAEFYVRQIANAIAPSNFVLTNPALLRETVAAKAENLVRGMHMLAEDIQAGHGDLRIRQSDYEKFEVGRNRTDAGQGDFPEPVDAAHPVRTLDRDSAQAATAHRSALDQQVLHSRSHSGKVLHPMVCGSRRHRIRHLLGKPGLEARREKF
jgi:polyhydroxyalkanoate synthase